MIRQELIKTDVAAKSEKPTSHYLTNNSNRATVLVVMEESYIVLEKSLNIAPVWVDAQQSFDDMMAHLCTQKVLALDTESNSMFRYYPKVCLIQISAYHYSDESGETVLIDYLIDSLYIENIESNFTRLGALLADPEVEVIIHAAENDILTMQRDFSFHFQNVFDTQLAARILGWKRVGLAAILEQNFDQISNKQMQRADWGQRPLTQEHIEYARMDTHYLIALRDRLLDDLKRQGHLDEAKAGCEMLSKINYHERPPSERSFWQMKGSHKVPREQTAILEKLWGWREREAQRQDRPPFRIARDEVLIEIAAHSASIQSFHDLKQIRGLSEHQAHRYGRPLLRAVEKGRKSPLPKLPEPKSRLDLIPDKPTQSRFDALRRWRTRVAQIRNVDSDIILSNNLLLKIARKNPQSSVELQTIREIDPWKAETYADEILHILQKVPQGNFQQKNQ